MDRWQSKAFVCSGGLDLSQDALTQGTVNTGTALILQNYEPALEGGYSRILGYEAFDSTAVPGENSVLGVKVGLGYVFAYRDREVYKSTGSGWTKISTSTRAVGATKARFILYSPSTPRILVTDGVDYAAKYDGTTYTIISGSSAPADPKYALWAKSRLFLSGYSSNPRSIIISAPNSDTDFTGGSGGIELVVGDIVVGLSLFRDTVYIFCENSIKKLTGSSASDFALSPVTSSIGCVSGDTIREIGGDIMFLAPDGLRSLAATDRIGDVDLALQSRPIQPLLRSYVNSFSADSFTSLVIRKKSQYRLFIFDDTTLDYTALYDLSSAVYGTSVYGLVSEDTQAPGVLGKITQQGNYSWATTLGINVYCADSDYFNGVEYAVFGHPADGKIYRMEQGYSFGGNTVPYIYKTPQMTFDDVTLRKVLQKIAVFTEIQGNIETTLNVVFDFGNAGVIQPRAIDLSQSSGQAVYGTSVYDTAVYAAPDSPVFRKNLIGSGKTAAFIFSGNDSNPIHRIDGFQVEYSVKQPHR